MDPADTPEHVARFISQNWSYGFADFPYSGDASELENLSDMDSMAVKMTVDNLDIGGTTFVYLEQYLADVSNFVGYRM